MRRTQFCSLFALVVAVMTLFASTAVANEPVEFEPVSMVRGMALSPDGLSIAYVRRTKVGDEFVVSELANGEVRGYGDFTGFNTRSVRFVGSDHLVLDGYATYGSGSLGAPWQFSRMLLVDVRKNLYRGMLNDLYRIVPGSGGIYGIAGYDSDNKSLLIPAFVGRRLPKLSLAKMNLRTHRSKVHTSGKHYTDQWFTSREGQVLAKVEYDEVEQRFSILARRDHSKWETLYTEDAEIPTVGVHAVHPDGDKLVVHGKAQNRSALYTLDLKDGSMSEPLYLDEEAEIAGVVTHGLNQEFAGVRYGGLIDTTYFLDEQFNEQYYAMRESFAGSSVELVSFSDDRSRSIYHVSGNDAASHYYLFEAASRQVSLLGREFPGVAQKDIRQMSTVSYKTRDDRTVTALITYPDTIDDSPRPLIVVANSAPQTRSTLKFDWFTQFLARKGYVVLQPNTRGTAGFGPEFESAGNGAWHKEVQHDIEDGVRALVDAGKADADRVCIIGSFFGGYSALASAAAAPNTYRCAVSVGGFFDVPRFIQDSSHRRINLNWRDDYLRRLFGLDTLSEHEWSAVSPVNAAEDINAPVLLIHERNDPVVSLSYSKAMHKALVKAGNPARLVSLTDSSDWRSVTDTRSMLLGELEGFLAEHNPAD